jgi:hypothetical protein
MSNFDAAPTNGTGDHMDANEVLVKERFDAAVGGTRPDVVSLVGGGLAAGRGMRRTRRLQGAVGVLAASALIAGALTATGAIGHLFDSQGPASNHKGTLVQLEPATPRGLAAAMMAHTSGLGKLIGVGGTTQAHDGSETQMRDSITAELGYRTGSGVKVDLQVVASPHVDMWRRNVDCSGQAPGTCAQTRLPDGTRRVVVQAETDGKAPSASGGFSGPHVIAVGILRDDSFVIVVETVVNSAHSPLDAGALQQIATDPTVGISTTSALNAEGLRIRHFQRSLVKTSGSSSGSETAPPPSGSATPQSAEPPAGTSTSVAPPG